MVADIKGVAKSIHLNQGYVAAVCGTVGLYIYIYTDTFDFVPIMQLPILGFRERDRAGDGEDAWSSCLWLAGYAPMHPVYERRWAINPSTHENGHTCTTRQGACVFVPVCHARCPDGTGAKAYVGGFGSEVRRTPPPAFHAAATAVPPFPPLSFFSSPRERSEHANQQPPPRRKRSFSASPSCTAHEEKGEERDTHIHTQRERERETEAKIRPRAGL